MENEIMRVKFVGLGRKWGDFYALDSYLFYFEDNWFAEKVYPDAFDRLEVFKDVDYDDIEFGGKEEGCFIEYEFEIVVDEKIQELIDNAKTANDFYRSFIKKINVFGVFDDAYCLARSIEFVNGTALSVISIE